MSTTSNTHLPPYPAAKDGPQYLARSRTRWHRRPARGHRVPTWVRMLLLAGLAVAASAFFLVPTIFIDTVDSRDEGQDDRGLEREGRGIFKYRRVVSAQSELDDICPSGMSGCQAFGKPEICCSPRLSCFKTAHAPAAVFCCNPEERNCTITDHDRLTCLYGYKVCPMSVGGGCCPSNTICDSHGCVSRPKETDIWEISITTTVEVDWCSLPPTPPFTTELGPSVTQTPGVPLQTGWKLGQELQESAAYKNQVSAGIVLAAVVGIFVVALV